MKIPKPYEFWINPERQDDEDFYRAYRKYKPGLHCIHAREINNYLINPSKCFGKCYAEKVETVLQKTISALRDLK